LSLAPTPKSLVWGLVVGHNALWSKCGGLHKNRDAKYCVSILNL